MDIAEPEYNWLIQRVFQQKHMMTHMGINMQEP